MKVCRNLKLTTACITKKDRGPRNRGGGAMREQGRNAPSPARQIHSRTGDLDTFFAGTEATEVRRPTGGEGGNGNLDADQQQDAEGQDPN